MKYIATLLSLYLLTASTLTGQALKFAFPSEGIYDVPPGGEDGTGEYKILFYLTNTGSEAVQATSFRELNLASGHQSYFCWDLCYDTDRDVSDGPITIEAGDTTKFAQYVVFKPDSTDGYSEVKMIFADIATGDTIQRVYKFSVGGVLSARDRLVRSTLLSAPYPNPASGQTVIGYTLPGGLREATLRVYNLIGEEVLRTPVRSSSGQVRLDVSRLRAGMYFVYLSSASQELASRKLIVH
ncbi:MAG: hypothetical protein OHK0039_13350 [Bacteroidia bacterium]